MMQHPERHSSGFTLVEVAISAVLLAVTLSLALAGFIYFLRGASQTAVQNELDIDVQTAMERIKYDLRLSSLDEMFFHPAGVVDIRAISFPLARDDDGDGAVELDGDGHILWDKTHIYHVWSGSPEQLRLTVFDPRDNSLTETERQEQIDSVVNNGDGASTYNAAHSDSTVIFENLVHLNIAPLGAIFDGYSTTLEREADVFLGAVVMSNGMHRIKFEVQGKHASSSGYKIGIDTIIASPCYGEREAEAQTISAQSGALATPHYMAQGSWSGNYQLYFPATAVGHYFAVEFENDRWEETNFKGTGSLFENAAVIFDTALSPYDFVVKLDGNGYNWYATDQTGDPSGVPDGDTLRGTAVRVVMRGDDMLSGGSIQYDGGKCYVAFRAGSVALSHLKIESAYIAECADFEIPSPDIDASTLTRLTFSGADGVKLPAGTVRFSDPADFAILKEKTYAIGFLVDSAAAMGSSWKWMETTNPTMKGSYIIPRTSVPTETDLTTATWSTRGDIIATNSVMAAYLLYTTYPTNGTYVSQIVDTTLTAPVYQNLTWDDYLPSETTLKLKIRSGNSDNLSDAAPWTNITAMTTGGAISPGNNRYFQLQAELTPNASGFSTPKLLDATVRWTGREQFVNIGGTFTKGPDYGVFKVTVDGREIKTGVVVDLEIFEDTRGYRGANRRVRSALTSEVTPLNTGR